MNYNLSLAERASEAEAVLSRQPKPSLQIIQKQVARLKQQSLTGQKGRSKKSFTSLSLPAQTKTHILLPGLLKL